MIASMNQWQSRFVDDCVCLRVQPVADHTDELVSLEHHAIAGSVSIRQHTYSTGRACAKSALSAIGTTEADYPDGLLRQEDGSVAWPANNIGSISHTNDWAMAAVMARGDKYQSIGIDIEQIDRVKKDILKLIATDAERDRLNNEHALRWGRVALFSIKESLYKCLRPIYGEFIRFKDVEIDDLDKPLIVSGQQPMSVELPAFYNPSARLLLPELASCCDERRIDIRLAVLDAHVVSFVGYT